MGQDGDLLDKSRKLGLGEVWWWFDKQEQVSTEVPLQIGGPTSSLSFPPGWIKGQIMTAGN